MNMLIDCPVCKCKAEYTSYSEDIGVVEIYCNCENCGYAEYMCYSPLISGILLGTNLETRKRRIRVLKSNIDRLKELNLKIYSGDEFSYPEVGINYIENYSMK